MRNAKFRVLPSVALMVVALSSSPLCAQKGGISVDRVHSGSVLTALAELPVRDRAPASAPMYVKGQQKGSLRRGEVITVSEEQIVPTLLGDQKWVRFSRSEKLSPSSGWVLVGTRGTSSNIFDEAH